MKNILKAFFATVGRVVTSWNNWNRRKEGESLTVDMNVVLSHTCSMSQGIYRFGFIPGHFLVAEPSLCLPGSLQIRPLYIKELQIMKEVEYGYLQRIWILTKLPLFLGLEVKNMASRMLGSEIIMQHAVYIHRF